MYYQVTWQFSLEGVGKMRMNILKKILVIILYLIRARQKLFVYFIFYNFFLFVIFIENVDLQILIAVR